MLFKPVKQIDTILTVEIIDLKFNYKKIHNNFNANYIINIINTVMHE